MENELIKREYEIKHEENLEKDKSFCDNFWNKYCDNHVHIDIKSSPGEHEDSTIIYHLNSCSIRVSTTYIEGTCFDEEIEVTGDVPKKIEEVCSELEKLAKEKSFNLHKKIK